MDGNVLVELLAGDDLDAGGQDVVDVHKGGGVLCGYAAVGEHLIENSVDAVDLQADILQKLILFLGAGSVLEQVSSTAADVH